MRTITNADIDNAITELVNIHDLPVNTMNLGTGLSITIILDADGRLTPIAGPFDGPSKRKEALAWLNGAAWAAREVKEQQDE